MDNDNPKRGQRRISLKDDEIGTRNSAIVATFTEHGVYQVLRVTQGRDGSIYIIMPMKNCDWHFSYHASGQVHYSFTSRKEEKRIDIRQGQLLSSFKGIESLGTFAFVKSHIGDWNELKRCDVETLLCLDTSILPETANLFCFLVERGRIDLLSTQTQREGQLLVITATDPWIALQVHSAISSR